MKKEKREVSIIRSSAAEYLTFITATGESDINAVYFEENVWLTQKMMGLLLDAEPEIIGCHLKKVFDDEELDENSVIRKFRITAADGKSCDTSHYNLSTVGTPQFHRPTHGEKEAETIRRREDSQEATKRTCVREQN